MGMESKFSLFSNFLKIPFETGEGLYKEEQDGKERSKSRKKS